MHLLNDCLSWSRIKMMMGHSLGVLENNKTAINCYESCGFHRVQLENVESYHCMGEVWDCIEMELVK